MSQIISTRSNGTLRIQTVNELPTLTQQQFKNECDVNHIMKKYEQTGQLFHLNRKAGVYADLSNITDYQSMLHTVMDAQEKFSSLPAEVRKKFDNDPSKLIQFLSDPKNTEQAVELGLVIKTESQQNTVNQAQKINESKQTKKAVTVQKKSDSENLDDGNPS